MKSLFTYLLICLPLFIFSQSQIEFGESINYSYRTLINEDNVSITRADELGKLNTHFSISYSQRLKEKIWIKLGLGFSSQGYKTSKDENIRPGSQHDGMGGFDPTLPSEFRSIQFKFNYQFLEIPVALRYEFSQKKWSPFFELGLTTSYYLQSVTKIILDDKKSSSEKFRDEDYINQIQLAPTLAFGITYSINEKWQTFISPNFRFYLTKTADAPVKQHLWSAGLALGMRMRLK